MEGDESYVSILVTFDTCSTKENTPLKRSSPSTELQFLRQAGILALVLLLNSCSTLVMEGGFKRYKADVAKTKLYKESNDFQQDMLYLNELCAETIPAGDILFPAALREKKLDSLLQLCEDPALTANVFNGYARNFLAQYNCQHVSISGLKSSNIFPFVLQPMGGEWYLQNINIDYPAELIGQRLIGMAGLAMKEVVDILSGYVSVENAIARDHQVAKFLNRPDIMQQLGVLENMDSVKLSFASGKEAFITMLERDEDINLALDEDDFKANKVTRYNPHNYTMDFYPDSNFAYFQFNRCYDQIDTYETMREYLKPWVVPLARMYMRRQMKKGNTEKLRGYIDLDRPVFTDYLELVFDSLERSGIDNLVIDLRNNSGGSSLLCLQLMYHLTDRSNLKDFEKRFFCSAFQEQFDKKEYKRMVAKKAETESSGEQVEILIPNGYFNSDSLLFEKITDPGSAYYVSPDRPVFRGSIVVLAHYGTGSAAALLTCLLQDNGIARVIGTSVGNNPTGATSFQPFKLKNTEYSGSVATEYLVRPKPENGVVLMPDFWVERSLEDVRSGVDAALDKALEYFPEGEK